MPREPTTITSLQNERVKLIRSLEMRKARRETGLFVAEGASILVTARDAGFVPRMLVVLAGGEHTLSTSNGPVTVTLPAGAQFRVDATTSRGAIKSEFISASVQTGRHVVVTVGEKPAATLKLHTSNGAIEIRKQK